MDLYNIMSNDGIGKGLFDEFNCHYVYLGNEHTDSDLTIRITLISYTKHSQLIEMLDNLTGKGVSMHALLLCETFMNQLNINESDIPGYGKYVNFRQNKGEVG